MFYIVLSGKNFFDNLLSYTPIQHVMILHQPLINKNCKEELMMQNVYSKLWFYIILRIYIYKFTPISVNRKLTQ